jgi:hypothetical protein
MSGKLLASHLDLDVGEKLQVNEDVERLKSTQCLCGLSCITHVGRGNVAQALYGFHNTSLRHDSTSHMYNLSPQSFVEALCYTCYFAIIEHYQCQFRE